MVTERQIPESGSVPLWMALACLGLALSPLPQAVCADPEPAVVSAPAPDAPDTEPSQPSFFDLDIDQLGKVDVIVPEFNLEVTSVTRSESTVGKSAAAIFVITPEMIRRSGAKSLPELLRMVPGLNVARISHNTWAVSSRGFTDQFSNELLVLIDGRSVYTPFFAGVHWDQQDLVLEDIARIEVIRGPGSTLWGVNAVNGVINVITKPAEETQGLLIASGGGSEDKSINSVRFGEKISENAWLRVYGKHFERGTGFDDLGDAADDWRQGRAGFRMDWLPYGSDGDRITFQGDLYEGVSGNADLAPGFGIGSELFAADDTFLRGHNLLGRWTHKISEESEFVLQTYYDSFTRNSSDLEFTIDTFDVDFTHRFPLGPRHDVTWGLQYRLWQDDIAFPQPDIFRVDPAHREINLFSAFLQDRITLFEDKLYLTAGSKFTTNSFTGFEYQPTGRLLWSIDDKRAAWLSVTRAVRIPSRFEDDIDLTFARFNTGGLPTRVAILGDRGVESEDLLAYEAGFRAHPTQQFSWDLAMFYNRYEDLVVFPARFPFFDGRDFVLPLAASNDMDGETYGFELAGTYDVSENWRVRGWYSFLQIQLYENLRDDGRAEGVEGTSPHNQAYLMSSWDLSSQVEFDLISRYVDNLPTVDTARYIEMDARLGWRPNDHWEFSIIGRNLLDQHHREFRDLDNFIQATEVERGVYAEAVLRY